METATRRCAPCRRAGRARRWPRWMVSGGLPDGRIPRRAFPRRRASRHVLRRRLHRPDHADRRRRRVSPARPALPGALVSRQLHDRPGRPLGAGAGALSPRLRQVRRFPGEMPGRFQHQQSHRHADATDWVLANSASGIYQLRKGYGSNGTALGVGLPWRNLYKPVAGTVVARQERRDDQFRPVGRHTTGRDHHPRRPDLRHDHRRLPVRPALPVQFARSRSPPSSVAMRDCGSIDIIELLQP
jgi:hypothetical protein